MNNRIHQPTTEEITEKYGEIAKKILETKVKYDKKTNNLVKEDERDEQGNIRANS